MSSQCRGGWLLVVLVLVSLPSAHGEMPRPDAGRKIPPATNKVDTNTPVVRVSHLDPTDGWCVAETINFRLLHRHPRSLAEELLRMAERTRAAQLHKWFGAVGANWDSKCRICLYVDKMAYSEATGVPSRVDGHTDITLDGERVLSRCIHLHGSRDVLVQAVLPHEVTHAILAGRFGGQGVPRWADEGIAILAEVRPRIERHLRQLLRCRDDEQLFGMRELVQMRNYPDARSVSVFYAQSVSLVEFLAREKGAKCFADFVRDGERDGYQASLKHHYGWNFSELDRHWQRYAFRNE